jgi:hypothetical protein
MKAKILLFTLLSLLLASAAFSQRRARPSAPPAAKTTRVRMLVKGTYEEIYDGLAPEGNANGKLTIKFEVSRWLTMGTNEVGNAEFSALVNGPAPTVSGFASYQGQVKGSGSGGDSYEATSNFSGGLAGLDVNVGVPEYTDAGNSFKIRVNINPALKGKCSLVSVRGGQTGTASGCANGTYFFSAASPAQIDDNDDPAKTTDTANIMHFGIELDIEPPPVEAPGTEGGGVGVAEAAQARKELETRMGEASGAGAGDDGGYFWRGAVTTGTQQAGFKILLDKTKDLPSDDKRSHTTRHLTFEATIVPEIPK